MKHAPILLVEDNPDEVALAMRALKKAALPIEVVVVRDGVEALERLGGASPTPFAMVLLDLKLPRLDGFDVLRRVREAAATRMLPVIILSSSHEVTDVVRGYELGTNSFVRKPLDAAEYTDTIRCIVKYWTQLNEAPPSGAARSA